MASLKRNNRKNSENPKEEKDHQMEELPDEASKGKSIEDLVAAALEKQQRVQEDAWEKAYAAALEKQQQSRQDDRVELVTQFQLQMDQQMAQLQALLANLQLAQQAGQNPPQVNSQKVVQKDGEKDPQEDVKVSTHPGVLGGDGWGARMGDEYPHARPNNLTPGVRGQVSETADAPLAPNQERAVPLRHAEGDVRSRMPPQHSVNPENGSREMMASSHGAQPQGPCETSREPVHGFTGGGFGHLNDRYPSGDVVKSGGDVRRTFPTDTHRNEPPLQNALTEYQGGRVSLPPLTKERVEEVFQIRDREGRLGVGNEEDRRSVSSRSSVPLSIGGRSDRSRVSAAPTRSEYSRAPTTQTLKGKGAVDITDLKVRQFKALQKDMPRFCGTGKMDPYDFLEAYDKLVSYRRFNPKYADHNQYLTELFKGFFKAGSPAEVWGKTVGRGLAYEALRSAFRDEYMGEEYCSSLHRNLSGVQGKEDHAVFFRQRILAINQYEKAMSDRLMPDEYKVKHLETGAHPDLIELIRTGKYDYSRSTSDKQLRTTSQYDFVVRFVEDKLRVKPRSNTTRSLNVLAVQAAPAATSSDATKTPTNGVTGATVPESWPRLLFKDMVRVKTPANTWVSVCSKCGWYHSPNHTRCSATDLPPFLKAAFEQSKSSDKVFLPRDEYLKKQAEKGAGSKNE
jgi:hypothetical protein